MRTERMNKRHFGKRAVRVLEDKKDDGKGKGKKGKGKKKGKK